AIAAYEDVLGWIVAEMMEADPPEVVLVARWHRARRGMDRVVEAGVHPPDGGVLRMRDAIAELLAAVGLDDVEGRALVAAAREPICDVAGVVRRVVPVERHEARCVDGVRIDQRAIGRVDGIAHVEHGLLLLALTSRVKDVSGDRTRRREQSYGEKLAEPSRERRALRQRVEHSARPPIVYIGPVAHT